MEPTLSMDERVTVRRLRNVDDLKRGDIIVFSQPEQEHKKYMKRIVGLAGDTVEVTGDSLLINGTLQPEPHAKYTHRVARSGPTVVPQSTIFVLGDNRANSLDSRHFGCVPLENIIGIVKR